MMEEASATRGQGKGTGLGLATVFGIVKQHRGSIWVYSEPGKGATFKIYLPQSEGIVQAPSTEVKESVSLCGTETVLVVEDEQMVRKFVCETLASNSRSPCEPATGNRFSRSVS